MSLGKIATILTLVGFVLSYFISEYKGHEAERKTNLQAERIVKLEEENSELTGYIKNNPVIPKPDTFARQGINSSLANRYYLIYVQIDFLIGAANISESTRRWFRDRMREGVLHHLLEEIYILGIDEGVDPPKIATSLSISIDWDKCRLISELQNVSAQKLEDASHQKTMALAYTFARIVEQENLRVTTRLKTATKPTQKALMTLGIVKHISSSNYSKKILPDDFVNRVHKTLHVHTGKQLEWREGDEEIWTFDSDVTPELLVKLRYIGGKKTLIRIEEQKL